MIFAQTVRYVWLAVMAADVILPFVLKPFYPGYSHKTQALSVLGCRQSPVKIVYNLSCIVSGAVFCLAGLPLYRRYGGGLTVAVWALLAAYGAGCEIISGLFPVEERREDVTIAVRVHGAGSALGFTAFVFVPLLLCIAQFRGGAAAVGAVSLACFAAALISFVCFVMGDKPRFAATPLAYGGLWQRLTMYFCYLPPIVFCVVGS